MTEQPGNLDGGHPERERERRARVAQVVAADGFAADAVQAGQYGDQQMKSGNAAILNHEAEGRALRVFMGARGAVTYEDEFELDAAEPWYETEAQETGNGPIRKVIVFRLRPKTIPLRRARRSSTRP